MSARGGRTTRRTPLREPERVSRPGGGLCACGCWALPFVLGAGAWLVLGSPLLEIHHVEYAGPAQCREPAVAAVAPGSRLFTLRVQTIEKALADDPIVESVRLERALPDRVRIRVLPRQAFLRVRLTGEETSGDWLCDREGVIFAAAGEGDTVPLLMGSGIGEIADWRVPAEALACCATWLAQAPIAGVPPIRKVLYRGDGMANLTLEGERLIKVGSTLEAERKLAAAKALLPKWPADGEYIDVELPEMSVIGRRKPPPPPPTESGSSDAN